ncbi:MAG: Smr/MutS family protein [Candidatus Binataceae bacterium]|jgi:DNA-nicking Smr family endonuclease
MARKAKPSLKTERSQPNAPKPVFSSPFKDLKQMLHERQAAKPRAVPLPPVKHPKAQPPVAKAKVAEEAVDEEALFREAFEGVKRLPNGGAERLVAAPQHKQNIISEDAEVLAALSDLVSGQGPFELTESDEYVEGMRIGLDPRLVTRLRRGEFSVQAHIDLHGLFQADAKEKLNQFIVDSVHKGLRAVLVVHGRGLRSPGGQAVLKHAAAQWLSHGVMGGYVLAFTTAQSYDGGAGALWVLLRRERRRAKFDVLQGHKRRD